MNEQQFSHLKEKELYPLPIDDGNYLIYAPLSGLMFPMPAADTAKVDNCIATGEIDKEIKELLDYVNSERKSHRTIPSKNDPSQIHKLSILPTYRCNFKCSYCYSAEGRQSKIMSREKAIGMIDYFIDRRRTTLHDLWLAILGGGEPFLSPEFTGEIITHAQKRAAEQGFNLGIGLTTNGSVYSRTLSGIMIRNKVSLGVSFEVLEDIQNSQRGHYERVVPVVTQYMDDGVDITVKSIITPANVNRLGEMVEELHRLFPAVKKYKLQIVEDPVMLADTAVMEQFYRDFTAHFFDAEQLGRDLGIDVYVLASKYVDMLIEHYCGGEMCLNPEGTITICHRKSSPLEEGYEHFVYGSIDDTGKVTVDIPKFQALISHDINSRAECRNCFAKWHCGGGCLAQSEIYSPAHINVICHWTRDFTRRILLKRFKENADADI